MKALLFVVWIAMIAALWFLWESMTSMVALALLGAAIGLGYYLFMPPKGPASARPTHAATGQDSDDDDTRATDYLFHTSMLTAASHHVLDSDANEMDCDSSSDSDSGSDCGSDPD